VSDRTRAARIRAYGFDPLDLERRRAEDEHFDVLAAAYGWPDGYLDDVLAGSDDDTPGEPRPKTTPPRVRPRPATRTS